MVWLAVAAVILAGNAMAQPAAVAPPAGANAAAAAPVPVAAGTTSPLAAAIDGQDFAGAGDAAGRRRLLLRAQVLLDRRHFSPGVIDAAAGGNMKRAVAAFQAANDLPTTGALDAATFDSLVAGDPRPVIRRYVLVAEDVNGPFAAPLPPNDFAAMAKRPSMTWTSSAESLAERAHMDEALLRRLNPGVDFTRAGSPILVVDTARPELAAVAEIRVDKRANSLTALDGGGAVLAVYPATVGSSERPAPSGRWAVRAVAPAPTYTFDPKRLTFRAKGVKAGEKLTIPAGPNNPVGATWIDLTRDTYGIHGTPEPRLVGKTASHGCVRLTNWDAHELAGAVKAGTKVVFTGNAA